MLPRTDGARETYVCRTRKSTGGASACQMPVLRREAVDTAALELFTRVALDLTATREQVAAGMGARAGEAHAQAGRAERDASELRAQGDRIARDYRAGTLSAASYERLSCEIAAELEAATSEAERLTAHAEAVAAAGARLDAEDATLQRLAELREMIAGRVNGAGQDIGALRAAWATFFASAEIIPADWWSTRLGSREVGKDYALVPMVRPEMVDVAGLESVEFPVDFTVPAGLPAPMRRVALGLGSGAADNSTNCSGRAIIEP